MKSASRTLFVLAALGLTVECSSSSTGTPDTGVRDTAYQEDQLKPDQQPFDQSVDADAGAAFAWAVSAGGPGDDGANSIAVDTSGNTYVTGNFKGTLSIGATTLTSKGNTDIFVAKADSSGKFVMAVSAGGSGADSGNSIAVDGSGNIHITGSFEGTAGFGSTTLTSKGSSDIFVAKADSSGKFAWAVSGGGTSGAQGRSIALDGSGASHVTGTYIGAVSLGNTVLASTMGSGDIFVAEVDSSGTFVSAVSAGGDSVDTAFSIAVDGAGNKHVVGHFVGTATFGTTKLSSQGNMGDVFVAKVDSSGKFVSAVSAGGIARAYDIAVDGSGNRYIAGQFVGSVTFGSKTLFSSSYEIFVAKLDSSDQFAWAVSAGGSSPDIGKSIAVDASGVCHVTGSIRTAAQFGDTTLNLNSNEWKDIFVARVDSAGKFISAVSAGGQDTDWKEKVLAIAVDGAGRSYIAGFFNHTASFGSTTLTSMGGADIFVARLDWN